jgi:hypothetical protein
MPRARIGLLGMPADELWNLDPLATACAARRVAVVPGDHGAAQRGRWRWLPVGLDYWIGPGRPGGLGIIAE